jgi:hypothetical protein
VATRAYYRLGTFSGLGGSTTNAVGLNATTTVLQSNILSVGYEYLNSNGTDDSGNIAGHQLLGSLGRQLTTQLFGGVSAAYNYTTESESQGGNFQIATLSVFGRWALPGKWLLNGSIGVSQLFAQSEPNRTTPAGTGTLSYFFPGGVATVGFSSGFADTYSLGQNFGVVDTVGVTGGFSYRVSPFISIFANAYYRNNEPTDVGGGINAINRRVVGAAAGVGIQLRRWLNLGLGYTYTDQSDPTAGAEPFTENRGFITLNASF